MGNIFMGVFMGTFASFMICIGIVVCLKWLIRIFQWVGDELSRTEDEREDDEYLDED